MAGKRGMLSEEESYRALAAAMLLQTVVDLHAPAGRTREIRAERIVNRYSAMRFLSSSWFGEICDSLDIHPRRARVWLLDRETYRRLKLRRRGQKNTGFWVA